ncbi:aspartate aminotransferase family protein [Roseovarius pelagicus]|uniref:Aminotransferase class III-fold pyridoxal phosphate-dependent enzyme n=1 Tax=Roseovarius pelagicus TaxID=2980108 RepID=A0ABY6DD12_9RHOB|nr:aminotransferase class III-fold pyridoxal phosphate-dependent enzyme [Roseovarius pelagicus]UXX83088.1 aminotransferase class III-fold pyridoxal phosphate-dependent enzyme [Roseovarius pelagicus]
MTPDPASFDAAKSYRERALKTLSYGVSSTPRGRQQPAPIVADRAAGAHIWDRTGSRFIDYAAGYGPLILGHSPSCVIDAVKAELDRGLRTASVHEGEATLAELVCETLPAAQKCAFVSSGSEAIQLALRIARAATGRTKVVKFRGNYHGWMDGVHVAGAPGNDGPGTIGQDPGAAASLTILDWGDTNALAETLNSDYAAVILEPVAVNGGCFAPPNGFLAEARRLTKQHGAVLIFDEVITGYRLALGGAQAVHGVTPDMAVIGKAMGGGLPIGAVVGSDAVMEPVSSGRLLHRGTFNGNPVSIAAAIACISHLMEHAPTLYPYIDGLAAQLETGLRDAAARNGTVCTVNRTGSAVQLALGVAEMRGLADTARADFPATARFAGHLLREGVQIIGRGLTYTTAAHDAGDIAETITAYDAAFKAMADEGGAP